MSDKKQRRKNASLRKEWLINGGAPNSGTQTAVTQGLDYESRLIERNYENTISNSYEGTIVFKSDAIMGPDLPTPLDKD